MSEDRLVIVTLSVVLLVELLLPLTNATINKIKTAPPTIHTQGCAYQSCCSVVVVWVDVVVVDVAALSCAHAIACVRAKKKSSKAFFSDLRLNKFFILFFFG